MAAPIINLTIAKGKTFRFGYLYADDAKTYVPIETMPQVSPVRLTSTAHGIPDGWPVQIECVKQPSELNTDDGDYRLATLIDANTIELVNTSAYCWKTYTTGGLVVFHTPIDLTGWSCRAQVRDKAGGTLLFSWHSDPLQTPDGSIALSGASVTFNIDAATTAALTWTKGVYDAELIDPSGVVFSLVGVSSVAVVDEVTV
jgi:hypothetical protein